MQLWLFLRPKADRLTCGLFCPHSRSLCILRAGMESISGSVRQTGSLCRAWTAPLYVLLLGSAGRSWAQQAECGVAIATPLRVENATGIDMLRAAASCTDGGSLETTWAGAVTLGTPISIASGIFLSITGEDNLAEVRGGSQTRMFEVAPGGELTLTHLKLSGGAFDGSGGAIYSDSAALVLDNCTFQSNLASNGDGGAVWADASNITILGGEFWNNSATGSGGAVAATGATNRLVVKEGSIFEGNTALVGGALYCSGVGESELARCSLNDAEFTSNTATAHTDETAASDDPSEGVDGGGAVALMFASANITYSVFSDNHAQHSGGAFLGGNGTDITVSGCKFENNTCVNFGGAIAAASMTLEGNTELTRNNATSNDDRATLNSGVATSSGGAVSVTAWRHTTRMRSYLCDI